MKQIRIDNLEFREAKYLSDSPEHPSYNIDYWYENTNYGTEDQYETDGEWYWKSDSPYIRKHKSCFKHPESCFTIASFNYDEHEQDYELKFVGYRPIELFEKDKDFAERFFKIIQIGNSLLNGA